jgi:hypothetical protein
MAVTSWRSFCLQLLGVLPGGQGPLGGQGLELAAGVGAGDHDGAAGDVQHPQRLPVPALAWRGEVVAGQGSRYLGADSHGGRPQPGADAARGRPARRRLM